ncbi:MAG: glycosyltransferase [Candidatus Hydrogenedentes bacterium]|nr:glycosyltransferase [Candidatus Hydrogenedentota bacterium]
MKQDTSMLLVLPVCYRKVGNHLLLEAQACNGIERWADNFSSLVVACPVVPEDRVEADSSAVWKDTREIACRDRVEFVPLPWAFGVGTCLRTYRATRGLLAGLIARSRYLQFGLWGLVGDWASVGALEAIKQRREYSLHVDIVNHVAVKRAARAHGLKRRLRAGIEAPLMKQLHAHLARHCALGLWHGYDCYQVYCAWCKNNHNVHDVHTKPEDCISPEALEAKARDAESASEVRVCYAGRATAVKGPLDWVRAVAHARTMGANLRATWIGDGPMLEDMRQLAGRLALGEYFDAPGFVSDRAVVLDVLRGSHIMPFAHLTPESPRCLLEALLSGTPIVGYDNAYAKDLVDGHGGGRFVPLENWKALGEELAKLVADRAALAALIRAAGKNGARFNDVQVFGERSNLVKKYLP